MVEGTWKQRSKYLPLAECFWTQKIDFVIEIPK